MPKDCPACCRALEEIERMVFQIEEITAKYLPSGEQREAVEKVHHKNFYHNILSPLLVPPLRNSSYPDSLPA